MPSSKRASPSEPCTQNPLWVPSLPLATALPTHPLSGFPEEAPHSLFLQEGHLQALQVQEPAQLQELPARKGKASGEQGEEEPPAGPSPSSWGRTSPGSSCLAQNRQKAHLPPAPPTPPPPSPTPTPHHPASLPFGAKGTVLYLPPRMSPGSSAHSGSLGLMARTFCLSPEEAISPPQPA